MRLLPLAIVASALLLPSCQSSRQVQADVLAVDVQPLEADQTCFRSLFRHQAERPAGSALLEVVDVSSKGYVLAGDMVPAPPNGTFRLMYDVTLLNESGEPISSLLPARVQDARFSPDGQSIAVLDASNALSVVELSPPRKRDIATQVFPGFAFSPDGSFLAYSSGSIPELDAYLFDLSSETSRQLTSADVPTWGFAFSSDGRSLAFVYSPHGFPSLYTLGLDAAPGVEPSLWTNAGVSSDFARKGGEIAPIPDSRKPPLWLSDALVFESGDGIYDIGSDGALVLERGGASGMFLAGKDEIHFLAGDRAWSAKVGAAKTTSAKTGPAKAGTSR